MVTLVPVAMAAGLADSRLASLAVPPLVTTSSPERSSPCVRPVEWENTSTRLDPSRVNGFRCHGTTRHALSRDLSPRAASTSR